MIKVQRSTAYQITDDLKVAQQWLYDLQGTDTSYILGITKRKLWDGHHSLSMVRRGTNLGDDKIYVNTRGSWRAKSIKPSSMYYINIYPSRVNGREWDKQGEFIWDMLDYSTIHHNNLVRLQETLVNNGVDIEYT